MTGIHQLLFTNFSGGDNVVTVTFTSSGVWVTPAGVTEITRWLVVAGGGGGGNGNPVVGGACGGGAGGFRTGTTPRTAPNLAVPGGNNTINVGLGGGVSTKGSDSSAFGIVSTGGGLGAGSGPGGNGGSGGGGMAFPSGFVAGTGNEGGFTPAEGKNGALGASDGSTYTIGGCGGGAQDAATAATNRAPANPALHGTAGDGQTSNITGVDVEYAGGGGGAGTNQPNSNPNGAPGGAGGGGTGGSSPGGTPGSIDGQNGTVNTGGGGGGGFFPGGAGGQGGSGIVIFQYIGN